MEAAAFRRWGKSRVLSGITAQLLALARQMTAVPRNPEFGSGRLDVAAAVVPSSSIARLLVFLNCAELVSL